MKKAICITQCMLLAAMVFTLAGCGMVPQDQHNALQKKHDQAQQENQTLKNTNRDLRKKFSKLTEENQSLAAKNKRLLTGQKARKEAEAKMKEKVQKTEAGLKEKAQKAREAARTAGAEKEQLPKPAVTE